MRYVITLLLLVIGLTSYSQGKFTRMGQQYFYLKTQKFGDTLLLDTAMFGTANMNNPNLFMKIDTTGMSVSGSVKVVLDTIPSSGGSGQDARVDSINGVFEDENIIQRIKFNGDGSSFSACDAILFDKNYFVSDGFNPCTATTMGIAFDNAVFGNRVTIYHSAAEPTFTKVDTQIKVGTYAENEDNIIEITYITDDTVLITIIN
jgi:hypothetical protein